MSESMKKGLLWAAAALGVLSLLQGVFRGMMGPFMDGGPKGGGHHVGQGGRGFESHHGMMGGAFPSGEYVFLVTIILLVVIVILVFIILKLWKKKQQPVLIKQVNEDLNQLDQEEAMVVDEVTTENEQRNNETENAEKDKDVQ